jgi:hypothetical protein
MINRMHLLETDENFKYYDTQMCKGLEFEIYMDDYGQSWHLAWIDPHTKEVNSWCCGSYNSFIFDMEDIADYVMGSVNYVPDTRRTEE